MEKMFLGIWKKQEVRLDEVRPSSVLKSSMVSLLAMI